MGKVINHQVLTNTLNLSECTDGYWLWDDTRGMNLSMKAKTEKDAFVEALQYYQRRLTQVEQDYSTLKAKVDSFLVQFNEEDD